MNKMAGVSLKSSFTAGELIISLGGKLTADNTQDTQAKVMEMLTELRPSRVTIDAAELNYISSSGLRLLLVLGKRCPTLQVLNVSRDVEEILQMTGIDKIMTVKRALREISVEGCPCIGRGQNGEVYRLGPDTIVKLFAPGAITPELAEQERQRARDAFLAGVPTAISYEVVRCGDRLGLVFELVEAQSLRELVLTEPWRMDELIHGWAELARSIHSLTPPGKSFPQMAEIYHSRIEALADFFTPAELDLLHRMTDSLPSRDTFLHGDFHQGNIMVCGKEMLLIDMADTAVGHPFFDIMSTYMLTVRLVEKLPPAMSKEIGGWDGATVHQAWKIFRQHYFQGRVDFAELEDMARAYSELRYVTFFKIFSLTDEFRSMEARRLRQEFFPRVEGYMHRFAGLLQQDLHV